jgi:xylan 1,4-beta-xylosidase
LDNYVVTAASIEGPWSEPIYLNSSGFDPSIFHDDDGKKWLVNLEWESRLDYEHPGIVVIQEYSKDEKALIGKPKRIWRGGTDRGCVEGPHLYKREGLYYLMCAEGGTGYGHCVTMARARNVCGDYIGDPMNPILTSTSHDFYSRHDSEFLKPYMYNPMSTLQKTGHASWTSTGTGEDYIVHLCARPYLPELRSILGRETAIQKMFWTQDGWLRLLGGGNLAKSQVEESALEIHEWEKEEERDSFEKGWNIHYATPRISPQGFASIDNQKHELCIRGQESLSSLNRVSLVARRVSHFNMEASCKLNFEPECFQQSAGITLYYNNRHYIYLRLYFSESLGGKAIGITRVENGERVEYKDMSQLVKENEPVSLKVSIKNRRLEFSFSYDGLIWKSVGSAFDASLYSDEYTSGGGFTGAFVGLACIDYQNRTKVARFEYFEYRVL